MGRRVRLTQSGKLVLEQAKRALAASDDVAEIARVGARGLAGRLTIGYIRPFPFREMTGLLRAFRRRRPGVALDLREMPTSAQLAAVRNGEIDCGFVRIPDRFSDEDLEAIVIAEHVPTVAVPASHRFAKRRSIRLSELADEDWIVIARAVGESFYDTIISSCTAAGFAPRIAQEAADSRIVLGFVAAGLGVTMVTSSARDLGVRGVHYIPLARRPPAFRFGLVLRRDNASAALAALRAEADTGPR